ncbi:MAG: polyphosphate polymerase domain-containing protein [bacterium]
MVDENKVIRSRHEFKYLCSKNQLALLNTRLKPIMKLDEHTQGSFTYRIRSIYFDDFKNSSFFENEDGITPREKWRIRAYNENCTSISLECKRKEYDKVIKDSCRLTLEQYNGVVSGKYFSFNSENKLLNRFIILQKNNLLKPKVIVGYERTPYIYKDGNVRITFDMNLFSSPDIKNFFEKSIRKRPILPTSTHMVEVKYDEYLPDFISKTVQSSNMERITFSKYYYSRKYSIIC